MNSLPTGWVIADLGMLTQTKSGNSKLIKGKLSAQPTRDTSVPAFSASGQDVWTAMPEHSGDAVIVSAVGARCGKAFLASGEWSAIANTHIVWPKPGFLNVRLLWYRINDENFWIKGGSAQPFVKVGTTFELPFSLPPAPEQKRIADKLDTVLTRVDAVNTRLARVVPILKRFRQSVLSAATSGRLTEDWRLSANLDNKWQVTDVQSVAHVGTGSTPLRSNTEFFATTGTPWITSAATSQEVVNVATEYVTQAAITAHRLKVYPVGTLLVAMYGEGKTRGQVTELGIPATINQACAAVVVDESKMLKAFVKLALQANYLEMRVLAEGGNQPNLNLSKVKGFPLPFPCLNEQAEIVRRVETLFAFADRLEANLQVAQTATDRLIPSMLAKAFRGELVPQDPNDEPASELLKRLAASTPATVTRKKRSKTTL
jgi:restriction endonuclease S subunit